MLDLNKINLDINSDSLWEVYAAEETPEESARINAHYSKRFENELKDEYKL